MIDIKKARQTLEARYQELGRRNLQLQESAQKDCTAIIDMIRTRYNPSRILQWGSLLHPERFNEHSDIDIAVEGITDTETYFRLLGDAMNLTRFSLDIVQMEKIEPEFAESIRLTGKVVYERA